MHSMLDKYKVTLLQANTTKQLLFCASNYVIYLIECILCKVQTSFDIRLNDHLKNVKNDDTIMPCKDFEQESHNFHKYLKFIIINQLTNIYKPKETLT